jgi:hypothetical protein
MADKKKKENGARKEKDQQLLEDMQTITDCYDDDKLREVLEMCQWDLDEALTTYFELYGEDVKNERKVDKNKVK